MLRSLLFCALFTAPGLAALPCPDGTTPVERKDKAPWIKACLDGNEKLHGPFEVWSRPAGNTEAGEAYQRTTKGQYRHGARTGTWSYWNIKGKKVAEKSFL